MKYTGNILAITPDKKTIMFTADDPTILVKIDVNAATPSPETWLETAIAGASGFAIDPSSGDIFIGEQLSDGGHVQVYNSKGAAKDYFAAGDRPYIFLFQ